MADKAFGAEAEIVNRLVSVAACSPHPRNYNVHPESQIEDLRLSLRRFGQVRSIIVQDSGDGSYLIVAGEGVWTAARAEGVGEMRADVIPVSWAWPKVLAYLAADNELARRASPDEAQLAALVQRVEKEADRELAQLAAGGELERETMLLQAELAEMLQGLLNGAGSTASPGRKLGDRARQVRPVLYVEDVGEFEQAVWATGQVNRGEALMEICRFYLRHHGGQEGQ